MVRDLAVGGVIQVAEAAPVPALSTLMLLVLSIVLAAFAFLKLR